MMDQLPLSLIRKIDKERMGKISILVENEVNFSTIKRTLSSFSITDNMRFSHLEDFLPRLVQYRNKSFD